MGVFDETTRKLGKAADWARHLKPERLAGQYEIYEGYDDDGRAKIARRRMAAAQRHLEAAFEREALVMGALGLAIGVALGVTIARRRR
jgi:hypothetical protein